MTVGAAPGQSGLLTGQRRFVRTRVGERPTRPVCAGKVTGCPPGRCSPPRRRHRLRYDPLLPADISQTLGENLLAVLHQLFAQGPWLPPAPSAGPERSRPKNDRQRRLSACTADLRVFAPEAYAIERACAECGQFVSDW